MLKRKSLHEYQDGPNGAVNFIKKKKKVALWLDMGLGKSVSTLTALSDLLDDFAITKAVIVAPLRVANTVWKQECLKWQHLSHLDIGICTGSAANRKAVLKQSPDILVINRENIPWLVENGEWVWDALILDEASSFKSHSAKRFKALRKVAKYLDVVVELTGTPSPNGMMDLWPQIFLLDQGERLGKNITKYRQAYFHPAGYKGYAWEINEGADIKIKSKLADICLSMSAEDYLELPERIDIVEKVTLPTEARKQYKELQKEFFLELEESDIMAPTAGALAQKLIQMANGAIYDADKNWHEIHDAKIERMKEIFEEHSNENFLIAYNFKHDLIRLQKAFPDLVVLSKSGVELEDWNKGKISKLACHPACLHPDTKVLTEYRGWVKIVDVELNERVYDGIEFVSHSGCHYSGYKKVIDKFGIKMTSNHKLLVNDKWIEARNVGDCEDTRRVATYKYKGASSYLSEMLPLRDGVQNTSSKRAETQPPRRQMLQVLRERRAAWNEQNPDLSNLGGHERAGATKVLQKLQAIWWPRNINGSSLGRLQRVLQRLRIKLSGWVNNRTHRCKRGLLQKELHLGYAFETTGEQNKQPKSDIPAGRNAFGRAMPSQRYEQGEVASEIEPRYDRGRGSGERQKFTLQQRKTAKAKVYDLVDCGPRNRFLIKNDMGEVFISHNSAGHGLNAQYGGCYMIWFGLNYSLELYQQFVARLHRQGQTKPVFNIHILAKGTLDMDIMRALEGKAKTQKDLLDYIKEHGS